MALKPVLQIEIDDSRFKKFKELFDRYNEQVKKLPGEWAKMNENINETKTLTEQLAEIAKQQGGDGGKKVQNEKAANKIALLTAGAWGAITEDVMNIGRHINNATSSLVKWSALTSAFSGLLGAGSLFGLDRLASSIASQRRQAMGLGVSYGQRAAFDTNYSRLLSNPGSLLSGANSAKYDYTSGAYNAFLAGGVSPQFIGSHNPAEISRDFLDKLDRTFSDIKNNKGMIGARYNALHLDQTGLSLNDLVAYLSASVKEKQELARKYANDSQTMNMSTEAQKRWTDLVNQLDRAWKSIESVFMTRMAAMAPAIEKLSDALVGAATRFAESKPFNEWLDGIGVAIEGFANFIRSDQFDQAETGFLKLINEAATGLASFISWIAKYVPDVPAPGGGAPGSWNGPAVGAPAPGGSPPPRHETTTPPSANAGSLPSGSPAAVPAPPASGSPPQASNYPNTLAGHEAFIRAYARYRGVNPDLAVDIARNEGMNTSARGPNLASVADVDANGVPFSYGDFQMNVRNGLGSVARQHGIDPADPNQWAASDAFAIDWMANNGYGPWHGDRGLEAWRSAGRLPAVRVQGNTGANPYVSNYGAANNSAAVGQ